MSDEPAVMVVGHGVIGGRAFYDLAHSPRQRRLHLVGRNPERVSNLVNMTRFSALQRGLRPSLGHSATDIDDVERTAEVIARVRPDLIFLAVSRQSWWVTSTLPQDQFSALAEANFGPWLPMHLAPVVSAMRAVRAANSSATVVNSAFPDAVHPMLHEAGLAPHVGIGNVANNVPALRTITADLLRVDYDEIRLRLVAHHYASHRMRFGHTGGAPIGLRVAHGSADVTGDVSVERMLHLMSGRYRRTGGVAGQAMVVSSALSIIEPLVDGVRAFAHAPGPLGLPGGYPIMIDDGKVSLDLPDGLSEAAALDINRQGQRLDGIASIEAGRVVFEEATMGVMRRHLGFHCESVHWSEAASVAAELGERFDKFRRN
jgi:hypothetical protein